MMIRAFVLLWCYASVRCQECQRLEDMYVLHIDSQSFDEQTIKRLDSILADLQVTDSDLLRRCPVRASVLDDQGQPAFPYVFQNNPKECDAISECRRALDSQYVHRFHMSDPFRIPCQVLREFSCTATRELLDAHECDDACSQCCRTTCASNMCDGFPCTYYQSLSNCEEHVQNIGCDQCRPCCDPPRWHLLTSSVMLTIGVLCCGVACCLVRGKPNIQYPSMFKLGMTQSVVSRNVVSQTSASNSLGERRAAPAPSKATSVPASRTDIYALRK